MTSRASALYLTLLAALPNTICSAEHVACRPGTFVTKRRGWGGVTEDLCFRCPAGKHTGEAGLAECATCGRAHFAPRPGSPACRSCPAGKYMGPKQRERTRCDSCPPGKHARSAASRACAACGTGTVAGAGAAHCRPCGAGTYAWRQGTSANRCRLCPAGRFFSVGASARRHQATHLTHRCVRCPRGRVAAKAGSATCETCTNGHYQPSRGGVTCAACPRSKPIASAAAIA